MLLDSRQHVLHTALHEQQILAMMRLARAGGVVKSNPSKSPPFTTVPQSLDHSWQVAPKPKK